MTFGLYDTSMLDGGCSSSTSSSRLGVIEVASFVILMVSGRTLFVCFVGEGFGGANDTPPCPVGMEDESTVRGVPTRLGTILILVPTQI